MQEGYDLNSIPEILKIFKVSTVVISGITDDKFINNIFKYGGRFIQINTNDEDCIRDNPLNTLNRLQDYDAIFINDDPNWYTVFNELNIIKETNNKFPLVFICNNNFPNKRRDSYTNPDNIPHIFRQKYAFGLPICYNDNQVLINDGFYHACEENTLKNGVLTAIEDFLNENSHVGMININLFKEITILYPKSQINQKRISIITRNIKNDEINEINISDKLIENQLLISYINKYNQYDKNLNDLELELSEKNNIISDYKNKIRIKNNELTFKETQMSGFQSKLSLKDSQLKNIESKLVNKNKKINNLENKLKLVNNDLIDKSSQINSLNDEMGVINNSKDEISRIVDEKNGEINALTNEIDALNNDLNSITQELHDKNNAFEDLTLQVKKKEHDYSIQINSLINDSNKKDKLLKDYENEYQYNLSIKNSQIESLKKNLNNNSISLKNSFEKKEDGLNNQIKLLQNELNEKEIKLNSLKQGYTRHLSKIDNAEYCISCFKEKILNDYLEINYLKKNNITKKMLSPVAYIYLILKSKPHELLLNLKLYHILKNSKCFDIGFYLNKNPDLIESKWCKFFSLELHYVCNGFDENRTFNKKYFNKNSKKDLFEYLLTCEK